MVTILKAEWHCIYLYLTITLTSVVRIEFVSDYLPGAPRVFLSTIGVHYVMLFLLDHYRICLSSCLRILVLIR
jgi:hypothetical protein